MAEEGEVKASGGEEKKEGGSLLTKILTIIFFISLFVLLLTGVSTASILMRNFEYMTLNTGSGGGGNGSLDPNCSEFNDKARPYIGFVSDAAKREHVDAALVAAIIQQESGWDPNAVSPAGAQGLMQLMPKTAEGLGVTNSFDPQQNINGGTKYIKAQLDRFGGDMDKAIAAYNAGPGAVEQFGGIPPYEETQNYVKNVKANYERFKKCLTGGGFVPSGDMSNNIKKVITQAEKEGVGWKQTTSNNCYQTDLDLLNRTFAGKEGSPIGMDQPQSCNNTQPPSDADLTEVSNKLKQGSIPIWHINGQNSGEHWVIIVDVGANGTISYLDPAIGGGVQTKNYNDQAKLNNGDTVPYFGRSSTGFESDRCLRGVYLTPKE